MSDTKTRNYRELLTKFAERFKDLDEATFDPASEITILLQEAGHTNPSGWLGSLDGRARDMSFDITVRRVLINRCWRTKLGLMTVDTSLERYSIQDNGATRDWIASIAAVIVPLAVEHNL